MEEAKMTTEQQTRFLSREFLIGMAVQTALFLVAGSAAWSSLTARVSALEGQQVTDARIARIEEKLSTLIEQQRDVKALISSRRDQQTIER